jgi:hypothetical protein
MDPRNEQHGTEAERDQPGREPQPGVDAFGRDDPFRGEHQEPEPEHRCGVHHRDGRADGDGLSERTAGADQIGADQRLPVAWAERVDRAYADSRHDHQRDEAG